MVKKGTFLSSAGSGKKFASETVKSSQRERAGASQL